MIEDCNKWEKVYNIEKDKYEKNEADIKSNNKRIKMTETIIKQLKRKVTALQEKVKIATEQMLH